MTLDKLVAIRVPLSTHAQLEAAATHLADGLRRRTTISDVIRLAVEDYLRRNAMTATIQAAAANETDQNRGLLAAVLLAHGGEINLTYNQVGEAALGMATGTMRIEIHKLIDGSGVTLVVEAENAEL